MKANIVQIHTVRNAEEIEDIKMSKDEIENYFFLVKFVLWITWCACSGLYLGRMVNKKGVKGIFFYIFLFLLVIFNWSVWNFVFN